MDNLTNTSHHMSPARFLPVPFIQKNLYYFKNSLAWEKLFSSGQYFFTVLSPTGFLSQCAGSSAARCTKCCGRVIRGASLKLSGQLVPRFIVGFATNFLPPPPPTLSRICSRSLPPPPFRKWYLFPSQNTSIFTSNAYFFPFIYSHF